MKLDKFLKNVDRPQVGEVASTSAAKISP